MASKMLISELINQRYSCRTFAERKLEKQTLLELEQYIDSLPYDEFQSQVRFVIVAADEGDSAALKGLTTYGMIKNPAAFLIGAVKENDTANEDFGYLMEMIVLKATELGLGSCWLGGTFAKSRFAGKIEAASDEFVPIVSPLGYAAQKRGLVDRVARKVSGGDHRKPWAGLFFSGEFDRVLSREEAGPYSSVLELVRLAPSSSNSQPWRIVKEEDDGTFHFYMQRTFSKRLGDSKSPDKQDMQRIDTGIAQCHFELSAAELGLEGEWVQLNPEINRVPENCYYVFTWKSD